MKSRTWLLEICTYLLALLFLFTALSKLINLHAFTRQMERQVFPKAVVPLLIVLIPLAELLAFMLLIRLRTRSKGLWLSLILMTVFTVYTGLVTLHVFPNVPCACAGAFNRLSWEQHLVLNGLFTFLALTAILLFRQEERSAERTPET